MTRARSQVRRCAGLMLMGLWLLGAGCKDPNTERQQPTGSSAVEAEPTPQHAGSPPDAPAANASAQASGRRIAALSPALAIIVHDLGFADDIVARHAFDYVLARDVPAAGDQAGLDYEMLLRVQPTHVLTQWGSRQQPARLVELASEQGWITDDFNPLTLEQIAQSTLEIDVAIRSVRKSDGTIVQPEQASERAIDLARQVRAFKQPRVLARPLRVLLLVGVSPTTALGPGSCHHELLVGSGATPALDDGLAFQDLTQEDLIRLAPDAMVLLRPRSPAGMNPTAGATDPPTDVWAELRGLHLQALRTGHVAMIDDPLCLMPSTAMIRIGEELQSIIAAWAGDGSKASTGEDETRPAAPRR